VPVDFLASVRATAVVALVTASFSSPMLVKSDAFANASARITGKGGSAQEQPREEIVAGGVAFGMPSSWGRLGASSASDDAGAERIGTVVSGLCPGGSAGATCTDGVQLTFVAYSGRDNHELPTLDEFEEQLDAKLAKQFDEFAKGEAHQRAGTDGTRYLDYRFSYQVKGVTHSQRFAAFRHEDGSGVVALASGARLERHDKAIDGFLATAYVPHEG
jgi:hypothetical protein